MNTIQNPFQIWEAVLYAFLNSFPYMVLVVYSFRAKWRFGRNITLFLLVLATFLLSFLTPYRLFSTAVQSPIWDIAISVIYIGFIFLAIREHIGKLVFTVLVLMDLGNLVVVVSKCIEGFFFPDYARDRYHYTYSLCMLPVLLALLFPVYRLIFKDICKSNTTTASNPAATVMWRYLWLVPAVFYGIWVQHFYTSGRSALENALNPFSTAYLILIDIGSVMIYRLIVKLVSYQEEISELQTANHALSILNLQYENLQKKMDEARRARHDLRHHILLLKDIRDSHNLDTLDELINSYPEIQELEQPIYYCENETINMILVYYSSQSAKKGIRFDTKISLPKDVFPEKTHLSVLLGNLLENAYEACLKVPEEAFIKITAIQTDRHESTDSCLTVIVENSYSVQPHSHNEIFLSSKHTGDGIGIESVRSIVNHYEGSCSFTAENQIFTASVILYPVNDSNIDSSHFHKKD